ncbi:MAG: L-aspartate oxidase [Paracoccaceae bacterium]
MTRNNDYSSHGPLIVGAGLAGLFTALKLAPLPCTVISPEPLGAGASSSYAQGGVAAAMAPDDSADAHAADTIEAGAGTVANDVAQSVTAEARARIEDLLAIGTPFEHGPDGQLLLSREAAHSAARVVRVGGDGAGRAIMLALASRVRATPSITVVENMIVDDLLLDAGKISGVIARHADDPLGDPVVMRASAVVMATGGIGGLYATTTNPSRVRGQGLGMAARAGAVIADPEFVQFHPTGIAIDADPNPLATEALRGHGATLITQDGHRFMLDEHPDAELAPRDIVARAIHARVTAGEKVFLDTREAIGAAIDHEFPIVANFCRAAGIDPVTKPIPVRPAQHYHMGGIATDAAGRSSLAGLWACGEVACTGLHGANRLASNSLLEALAYGARIAHDLQSSANPGVTGSALPETAPLASDGLFAPAQAVTQLRSVMDVDVGVTRTATGLAHALKTIAALEAEFAPQSRAFLNMTTAATLVAAAAYKRCESRGGHYRSDFPQPDAAQAKPTRMLLAEALDIRAKMAAS